MSMILCWAIRIKADVNASRPPLSSVTIIVSLYRRSKARRRRFTAVSSISPTTEESLRGSIAPSTSAERFLSAAIDHSAG